MNWERRRYWLCAGAALVAGLLLRVWFVRHMALIAGDSLLYGDLAKNLLRHGIYGFTESGPALGSVEIRPTLIRLPGYPLFLAACFRLFGMEHYRAALYVQVAADLVTCWLAGALAGRIFSRRAGLCVLWLAALCPFTASYAAIALTETLVLTSIALAFYGFVRWQDMGAGYNHWLWVVAGALAWSILLRPDQGLLSAAILPAMLLRALRGRRSGSDGIHAALPVLVAAMCVLLPLVPWTIRNAHTFHVLQPLAPRYANDPGELAPLGFARWYRTWAIDFASTDEVYWNYSGDRIELADLPQRAFDVDSQAASVALRNRTATLLANYNGALTEEVNPAIDARFDALAAERIHAHPVLYYLGLPVARVLNMALRPRIEMMPLPLEWWRWKEHHAQTAFAAAYAALNFGYIALGFVGFYLWRRGASGLYGELAIAMAASIILRALLLLTIDNSEPRYTLEFFPVLLVWAGAFFAERSKLAAPDRSA